MELKDATSLVLLEFDNSKLTIVIYTKKWLVWNHVTMKFRFEGFKLSFRISKFYPNQASCMFVTSTAIDRCIITKSWWPCLPMY